MRAVRAPTEKAYQASIDRENPIYLPAGVDTASPAFREEHGGLYVCDACGYRARLQAEPAEESGQEAEAAEPAATGRGKGGRRPAGAAAAG